ncbi:MAG: hypothetical protein B7C24_15095 [Bacteroidetes bacterium 4572_77]|nr:MAG: hypothetical protein B7C24_15095 [Bacteroidetes bacterium 4572_77]
MNKLKLLFILLTFISIDISAQKVVFQGQFFQFSAGSKFNTVYDKTVGATHYKGLTGSARFAYINNSANFRWWTELDFDGGFFNSYNFPSVTDRVANQISGGYNFGFVKPIHKFSNELYLWGGASVTGRYAYNDVLSYSNSSDNYTFLNNLGLNGMLHYTFNMFDRWWSFEWFLNVPFVTYYMRPGYSVNFPDSSIGESNLATFNKFFEIDSEIRLVFPLMNENKISLEYHWDYFSLNTLNKVQYASHGIFITAYFKLNHK